MSWHNSFNKRDGPFYDPNLFRFNLNPLTPYRVDESYQELSPNYNCKNIWFILKHIHFSRKLYIYIYIIRGQKFKEVKRKKKVCYICSFIQLVCLYSSLCSFFCYCKTNCEVKWCMWFALESRTEKWSVRSVYLSLTLL